MCPPPRGRIRYRTDHQSVARRNLRSLCVRMCRRPGMSETRAGVNRGCDPSRTVSADCESLGPYRCRGRLDQPAGTARCWSCGQGLAALRSSLPPPEPGQPIRCRPRQPPFKPSPDETAQVRRPPVPAAEECRCRVVRQATTRGRWSATEYNAMGAGAASMVLHYRLGQLPLLGRSGEPDQDE